MANAKRKKKAPKKTELGQALVEATKEVAVDIDTADAENPQVIAKNVMVPKKRQRAPRNQLGAAPGGQSSLKAWFTNKIEQDARLKPHHLDGLKMFLKGLGIQEGAGPAQYEAGLKKYFGE